MRRLTRRQALGEMVAAAALLTAGCDLGGGAPEADGSTLTSTWIDPDGTGTLVRGPGERLLARTELAGAGATGRALATLVHVTDAHVLDASSPARVPFLNRIGVPFQSTFRPHETLTTHVFAGITPAVRALRPDAVIQGGDLLDNVQENELRQALEVLGGGLVRPGSGPRGYYGVQLESNPDPFYYRPDIDAPRYPGLLSDAVRPFRSAAPGAPWYPVLGDHDILVAGEIPPNQQTRALAVGGEALWELPPGLRLPPGISLTAGGSPDGPPVPGLVDNFLAEALAGPKVRVPADASRRQLDSTEVVTRLQTASRTRGAQNPTRLDYRVDIGAHVRLIVLDLARRDGGSGGLVRPDQPAWLEAGLAAAGGRWVIVISHQPLASSEGGDQLLAVLDRHPRVLAALAGHTHRNRIEPRRTSAGSYWLINTASLIDYPQQARAISVVASNRGRVALKTWMLDHVAGRLGTISRQLAYLDAHGGRPKGFAGARQDRNAILYL